MLKKFLPAIIVCLLGGMLNTAHAASEVWLTTDQVRTYKLKKPVSDIVVGNANIANVVVREADEIFFQGLRPGLTNVYFYDKKGNELDNLYIRVRSPSQNMVTLLRGTTNVETYSCTNLCEETIDAAENN